MTKRREPLTYQHTLEQVARVISWERAGAICGVSARSVRLWSDHDCETEIRMIDAERLDRAYLDQGGDYAPFHRLMALRLEMTAREADADRLAEHAGRAAIEAGEAVAAAFEASRTRDPSKIRAARKEVQQAIDALTDCAADLEGGGSR